MLWKPEGFTYLVSMRVLLEQKKYKKNMFYSYKQFDSDEPILLGTFDTIEEAANVCDFEIDGDRGHECVKSLIERRYYLVGYSSTMLYIEEKD